MELVISAVAHRSGSTLLQRICNARRGNLIWGEHGGALSRFVELAAELARISDYSGKERAAYFGSGEDPNHWIANMTPGRDDVDAAVTAAVRAFLERLYGARRGTHDTVGFKEVRYGLPELRLLRAAYPDVRLLLLVRDPAAVWRSVRQFGGFGDARYRTVGAFVGWWNRTSADYAQLARADPRCTLIRFERLAAGEEATLAALHEAAGVGRAEALSVLQRKISTGGGTPRRVAVPEAELRAIAQGCRAVWQQLP